MKRILLGKTIHKDLNCITLRFEKEEEMIRMVRDKIPALKWSATLSSWYLREQDFSLPELFKQFKGLAFLDYTQLKNSNAQKILTKNKNLSSIKKLPVGW